MGSARFQKLYLLFKRKSVTVSPCLCVGGVLLLSQATTPAWTLEHFEADLLKT